MPTYKIKGLDDLLDKLDSLEGLKAAVKGMEAAALHVKGKIAEYPPASEANSPSNPSGRWYERGYGPRWPGGGKRTSETLGRKWTTASRDDGLTQIVGNNVSYGPFVQSADAQAWFHKKRGWKTDKDVIEQESDKILEFVKSEIDRVLES